MANKFLKGLAVAAGTGIAMGISSGRVRSRRTVRYRTSPDPASSAAIDAAEEDAYLNIEPLLDRLENLEARIETIEQRPSSSHRAPAGDFTALLADLERRVEENTRGLAQLRESVTEAERRATRSAIEANEAIPSLVEQTVTARFDDLRHRFSAEMEQTHQRTLASFERAIDEKISSRIGSIERALADQAGSIEGLRVRAAETDNNLQRLVSAIEKLCERTQLITPVPEAPPAPAPRSPEDVPRPFDTQLYDAMRREPVVPLLRQEEPAEVVVEAPAFTGSEPKKSRFLFRNLIVAGLSLLASRFVR